MEYVIGKKWNFSFSFFFPLLPMALMGFMVVENCKSDHYSISYCRLPGFFFRPFLR
ncbi:hypothetical protein BCR42DRAFT_29502 [Absidia repens]|uniref:Uncharacterized protein n=1 Tax=Absidia repens TaxID=90262 RepID=A0A1X2IJ13_9FUNG|nr:hypothetical protein BCR42DRAFT_29502 [Absidia repens]